MAVCEITLDQLLVDDDWAQVFADETSGNTNKVTEAVPPGSTTSTAEPSRGDVGCIIAAVNGDNDGPDWLGLFLLKDGRYLVASGGCDYTGWDCQASNSLVVAASMRDALVYGLSEAEAERLGLGEEWAAMAAD